MKKDHVAALKRAIEIAGGSQAALAARLREAGHPSVTQQTVSYWLANKTLLETDWWPYFERATGGAVTRRDLRPDVFSRDHAA